jgi:predicted transcriptional regulator
VIIPAEDHLEHYGTPRHSGRYPWGSGDNVTQQNRSLLDNIQKLKAQGLKDIEIAKAFGMNSTEYRAQRSIAKHEQKASLIAQVERLAEKKYSNVAIGKLLGIGESQVRALRAPGAKDRNDVLKATSNMLKEQVDTRGYIDIGKGTENWLKISPEKLKTAVAMLEDEGYVTAKIRTPQLGTGNQTTVKVLAPPGTPYKEIFDNRHKIQIMNQFSEDGGRTFDGFQPPLSVNSKRIEVKYADEGGSKADGVMYIRPGVSDISIGNAKYAQVRVKVDDTHYLKGMAVYKDDLPKGVDLVFHTNKDTTGNKLDAMKSIKDDPENPFGAVVDQIFKKDPAGNLIRDTDGKPIVTSAMNIVAKEGDWEGWKRELSSQMLSKQSRKLVKSQLDATYEAKQKGLNEILALTNPTVRKKLLEGYADAIDSSASHLDAASMPRQGWHVILPINSLKDTEVYAPNFRNGERVVLIRYPHGGIFEIPELMVNNSNREAKAMLGTAPKDAIGINSKVAQHLSGADFDGDSVLVIPNNAGHIKSAPILAELKNFDPKKAYPKYEGMKVMDARTKGIQMGDISNLITDMTVKGANQEEISRAVRHSMVVIDAEKWELNYKQSAHDMNIPALKEKYQGKKRGGADTLLSKAGSKVRVPDYGPRRANEGGPIDINTGQKKFRDVPKGFTNKEGVFVAKTRKSTKLAEEENAFNLVSGTPETTTHMEAIYATHSNKLKALANDARKELVRTPALVRNPSAAKVYATEVNTLNAKLNVARMNAPLERKAQLLANTEVSAKRQAHPEMDLATLKKTESIALIKARKSTGAEKQDIFITDKEWSAIQAGAISDSKLSQILDKANQTRVKELATPKTPVLMSSTKQQRAKSMLASGYTQAQVADALGVSLTTLKTSINDEG